VAAQGGRRGRELEARRPRVAGETMHRLLQCSGRKEKYEERLPTCMLCMCRELPSMILSGSSLYRYSGLR
jgi:hypothetical protein